MAAKKSPRATLSLSDLAKLEARYEGMRTRFDSLPDTAEMPLAVVLGALRGRWLERADSAFTELAAAKGFARRAERTIKASEADDANQRRHERRILEALQDMSELLTGLVLVTHVLGSTDPSLRTIHEMIAQDVEDRGGTR